MPQKMLKPGLGRVMIKPDGDISELFGGFKVNNFVERYNSQAISGVVVSIADDIPYYGRHSELRRSGGYSELQRDIQEEISLTVDVPVEIKVGDRVLFNYLFNVEDRRDPWIVVDSMFVIPYSQLWAKEGKNGLIPLNGWVFVVECDDEPSFIAAKKRRGQCWQVVLEGTTCAHYDNGSAPDEGWGPLFGKKVLIDPSIPMAFESRIMARWNVYDKRLHAVTRANICAVL